MCDLLYYRYIEMGWKLAACITLSLVCGTLAIGKGKGKEKHFEHNNKLDLLRLAKQVTMQQFYAEESTRSNGHSGLKVMRHRGEGTQPYHGTSHSDDFTVGATHDHSDFFNTCGMGEVAAVLNGIHFGTRHNDYLLVRKADNDGELPDYDATVDIPYPDVPPTVLEETDLNDQIYEMRKYFEAFNKQDSTIRNYKPYFKAHLCYMEGTWTDSDPDEIQEAFFSERHFYDAFSWKDLFQKKRYEAYSGTKLNLENWGFLPTTLWDVQEDGTLVFGQWNYKILCHQLDDDLPLNRLRAVDDLKTRMSQQVTYEEAQTYRNARYQVNPNDRDEWFDEASKWSLLDRLFEQIPGPDGYGAHLEDTAFDNVIKRYDAAAADATPLNVNYYHRWFQNLETGAMGGKVRHRGFSDEHMWTARTTQPRVLATHLESCDRNTREDCNSWEYKWVYAMPMEIIYTTPLMNWNPHGIKYHGLESTPEGSTIFDGPAGVRDGTDSEDMAFNGTNSGKFYHTPYEFFEGDEFGDDPADTPYNYCHVLNEAADGMFKVRSSGIRTFMPSIPGIGRLRQRYPVHTLHGEGSPVWKELSALKEIVMDPKKYEFMIRNSDGSSSSGEKPLQLRLGASNAAHGSHTHQLTLTPSDLDILLNGGRVTVTTELVHGHDHSLEIERDDNSGVVSYRYITCNGEPVCADDHPVLLLAA